MEYYITLRTLFFNLTLYGVIFCSLIMHTLIQANNSVANSVAIDQNNKIVIGGFFDNGVTLDFVLVRYNPDGSLDTTFNTGGPQPGVVVTNIPGTNSIINWLVIDSQNRIVVAGLAAVSDFMGTFAVARYNPNGTLDPTFNPGGPIPGLVLTSISGGIDSANSLVIDKNNKIVVTGSANPGTTSNFAVVRYNEDGTFDTTFNPDTPRPGIVVTAVSVNDDIPKAVVIDDNNKILVAGITTSQINSDIALVRYNENGTLDQTFGIVGRPGIVITDISNNDAANDVKIDLDNKIVVGGFSSQINTVTGTNKTNFTLVRYNDDGTLDTTFNPPTALRPGVVVTSISLNNDVINSLVIDMDNRIVVTGFANNNNNNMFATARYNPNGLLDPTFNPPGLIPGVVTNNIFNGTISPGIIGDNESNFVVLDQENRIVVTGFSSDGTQNNVTTVRYTTNGFLDITFNVHSLVPGIVITSITNGMPSFPAPLQGVDDILLNQALAGLPPEVIAAIGTQPGFIAPEITEPRTETPFTTPQPTIAGTAQPLATVTILVNGMTAMEIDADQTGRWLALLPPLDDGTYTIVAAATDRISNLTVTSEPITITMRAQPPASPTIEAPKNDSFIRTPIPVIRGTAQAPALISLYLNNNLVGTIPVDPSGRWTYSFAPLSDGRYDIYAVAQSEAGTHSTPSPVISFTIDTQPPRPPLILAPTNDSITTNPTPMVTGEAKPHSAVNLLLDNKPLATVNPNSQGRWSYTLPFLSDGKHRLTATINDPITRASLPATVTFTVNTQPLNKATITSVTETPQTNNKPLITGRALPKSSITLFIDGNRIGTITADADGYWRYSPQIAQNLPIGLHELEIAVADPQGNINSLARLPFEITP
jgi:uncharacterized delta-60 repeat protein